jgi:hypothetical protein
MAQLDRPLVRVAVVLACAALAGGGMGCGALAPPPAEGGDLGAVIEHAFPMCADMELKASSNGICQNGLAIAGLTETGLALEAMDTPEFAAWFDEDAASNDVLLRYLVKCAAPASELVTWTSPNTTIAYGWPGGLGVAPGWASGNPMTPAEQQLLSACLGAHVNKFGVAVPLAVEGRTSTGEVIALDPGELETFSVREACFFGDLFAGEGVLVGIDHDPFDDATSSLRACAFDSQAEGTPSLACPPMVYVGSCAERCVADASGTFYESCEYGGKTYLPVATRLRPSEIFSCGDGVCQFTESCGTGVTVDSCALDCGVCL